MNKKFQFSKKAVEFEATHDTEGEGGDELRNLVLGKISDQVAERATTYVNHVYYVENQGFKLFETVSWDGMVSKTGVMKHYWREKKVQTFQRVFELEPEVVDAVMAQDFPDHIEVDYEITREYEGPSGEALVDIEIKRTATLSGTKLEAPAPEDFLVLPGDDYVHDEMRGCFERIRKTRGEWIAEGYDADVIMSIPTTTYESEEIRVVRDNTAGSAGLSSNLDPMNEEVICIEAYIMVDRDGDGIPERRRCLLGGDNAQKFIEDEPYDGVPYTDFCPFRMPHTFYGDCPADRVADLQRLNSELIRQQLDYGVELNTPTIHLGRGAERADGTTMVDVLDRSTGGVIRVEDVNQIRGDRPPDMSNLNQYLSQFVKQKTVARTGASEIQPASDPNSLQPGSATETWDRRMSSDEIKDYIAASYADSLGRVFQKILRLEVMHADRPKTIKVGKEFQTIDPRILPREMSIKVNVGLGSGSKAQTVAYLMGIKKSQEEQVAAYGWADENPARGFVTKNQYFNTCRDIVRAMGFDDPDRYFSDPTGKSELQIPPEMLAAVQQKAMQEAMQSALVQLEKYKVDANVRAKIETEMIRAQQKESESEREAAVDMAATAQKDEDSRRDAETKRFEIVAEQSTARQEIAADVEMGRRVNARNDF